jgi:hypothetical protein
MSPNVTISTLIFAAKHMRAACWCQGQIVLVALGGQIRLLGNSLLFLLLTGIYTQNLVNLLCGTSELGNDVLGKRLLHSLLFFNG